MDRHDDDTGDRVTAPPLRAAQYVRMSAEHQQYSVHNQIEAIARYAANRRFDIMRTYADEGRSGLSLAGRPALQKLLADVAAGMPGYDAILVYDVSRLGRFQDPDEAASYELRCRAAGIETDAAAGGPRRFVPDRPSLSATAGDLLALHAMVARQAGKHRALFGDPAFDILLALRVAVDERSAISVTSACYAANCPMTTALRYTSPNSRRRALSSAMQTPATAAATSSRSARTALPLSRLASTDSTCCERKSGRQTQLSQPSGPPDGRRDARTQRARPNLPQQASATEVARTSRKPIVNFHRPTPLWRV
jgi:hypothetical protein